MNSTNIMISVGSVSSTKNIILVIIHGWTLLPMHGVKMNINSCGVLGV